jgi:hypothetical protein
MEGLGLCLSLATERLHEKSTFYPMRIAWAEISALFACAYSALTTGKISGTTFTI